MAGFMTDYTNNKIIDFIFGGVSYTPPQTYFVGLSRGGSFKNVFPIEPVGGGYSRVALANSPASFSSAIGGTKSNSIAITFPVPSSDWGTIVSLFIADAPSGGNIIATADLAVPRSFAAGSPAATIAVGALYLSHT